MYRKLDTGELRPVEGVLGLPAQMLLEPGPERSIIQLWHGNCLEAEVEVSVINRNGEPEAFIVLKDKKELRQDAPPEAIC
jgi:hypothetical protein